MIRRSVLLALFAGALLVPSAAQAAPEPGLNLSGNFFSDPVQDQALVQSGAKWARVFVFLDGLDSGTMSAYTSTFNRLNSRGINSEAVLLGNPNSPWRQNPAGFASAAKSFVQGAGPGLKAIEVWNEEDQGVFWAGGGDVPAYAEMLRQTSAAVRSARPDLTVLIGGLTGNDSAFLGPLLQQPGVPGTFDGVGVHSDTACNLNSPYVTQKDNNGVLTFSTFLGYKELLKQLSDAGRPDAKIWFTEIGWSTSTATCDQGAFAGQKAGGVSEDDQAKFLTQGYHCLTQDAANIGPSFWFSLSDITADDTPDGRYGLLRRDDTRKPAFAAFTSFVQNGDSLGSEPCGNLSGPAISVTELGDVVKKNKMSGRYGNQLHIRGAASDPDTVGRVTLYVDGKKIRNFSPPKGAAAPASLPFCINVDSAKKLALGAHTIRLEAKSGKSGNASSTTLTVKKVKKTKANKKAPAC